MTDDVGGGYSPSYPIDSGGGGGRALTDAERAAALQAFRDRVADARAARGGRWDAGPDYLPPTRPDAQFEPWNEPPERPDSGPSYYYPDDPRPVFDDGSVGGNPFPYQRAFLPTPADVPELLRRVPAPVYDIGAKLILRMLRFPFFVLGTILLPGNLEDDPWYPLPQALPKGPLKRPKVGIPSVVDPNARPPLRRPDKFPGPDETSDLPWSPPRPRVLDEPWMLPTFDPSTFPTPRAIPVPTPNRWALPDLLPFLPLLTPFLMPGARPVTMSPFQPGPGQQPNPNPIQQPFASPQYFNANDRCNCTETKTRKKKKKDSCTNPIVSKRKRTKGGTVYQTITRRIECQA